MPYDSLDHFVPPNLGHPEVMRSVFGRDQAGRIVLAVAVEPWLFDELAAFGTELEDIEPAEDEEGRLERVEERLADGDRRLATQNNLRRAAEDPGLTSPTGADP